MSQNSEVLGPKPGIESSLKSKSGGHGYQEKRGDVQLSLREKLQSLFDQLPEHSKIVVAREIREAGDSPEEAIVRIEKEIRIREIVIDHLKHSGDPQAALAELRKSIPEETIQ